MAQGLERIPLAVDSDFKLAPVRANFPDQTSQEVKIISVEPDQQPAATAAPQSRSAGDVLADTAFGFAKGAGSLVKGLGWLAGSDTMQSFGQDAEDYWGEKQTAELKRQLDAVDKAQGFVGTLESLWKNPGAIGDYVATSLPMMIPGMGAGSIGARGIVAFAGNSARNAALKAGASEAAAMQAGRIAAEKAAEKAAMRFAVGTNMVGEGAVSGGVTGADVEKFMLSKGATPEQAKAEANKAAMMAGAWTTAGAGIGAGMEARAMLGRLKDTGVKGLAKNVGKEALEEAIQNPGEDYAGYQAKVKVDPTQTFDPAKSATLGAVTGGIMGGGFHAAGRVGERLSGRSNDKPDDAIPAADVGAGPGGGSMAGEFIPADRRALPGMDPMGATYDQPNDALPPGQAMLPRTMLPAPEDGGPSERQIATAMGLLKHSPKASPELLSRLMRVDETMAGMLFNHWKGGQNVGTVSGGTHAQVPAQGGQAGGDLAAGGGALALARPDAGASAGDRATGLADVGGGPGASVGGAAPGSDAITDLDVEAHAAATSPFNGRPQPTEAQKQAGNYAKGHVKFQGLEISVENPAGSVRSGTDSTGRQWQTEIKHHYGYIKGTVGKDKDHLDVFLKKDAKTARTAYVIDQIDPKTGKFDEHKIVFGADNEQDARDTYLSNYEPGWSGLGEITAMPMADFKAWLKSGKTKQPLAYQAPKNVRSAPRQRSHDTETLWGAIQSLGGISMDYLQDITGESSTRKLRGYPPGLFRHGGQAPDELARALANDYGFAINLEDARDNGGVNQLTELIQQRAGGTPVWSMARMEREFSAEETRKHQAEIIRLANEYGVEVTDGRKRRDFEAIEADVEEAIVFELGRAGEQFAEMHKLALGSGIGEDQLSSVEDDIANSYDGDKSRDATVRMYREMSNALQELIDEREGLAGQGEDAGQDQDAPGNEAADGRPPLELAGQTEAEARAERERVAAAEAQRLKDDQAADNKRQADAERDSFTLTGSDRPADTMAARGQGGLFDAPTASKAEDKYAEIDRGFAENRAVLGNFKKGDRVSYVAHGTYTQNDGTKLVDPVRTGTVTKISDKDQGIVEVDGNIYVAARRLTKIENSEKQPAAPVAESHAPAQSEPGEGEVATAQADAAPVDRKTDAEGNPIYKMGERVEYVSGNYAGRHGSISDVTGIRMTSVMIGSGAAPRDEGVNYYYRVKTDNGGTFMASAKEIQRETEKPESVVPDIEIDGTPTEPEAVLRSISYAKQSADKYRAAAQRARKADMIAQHKRSAQTQDEKAARYQAAFDAWAQKHPADAEKLAPQPAAKPAGSTPAASGDAIKAAGLTVTKTTTKNGKPVWEVGGNTKEHYELLKRLGGRWYGPKKVWSFYNDDPTAAISAKLPAASPTIAGTPTIAMTDKALEQIAASSQPAAEKAKAELEARDKADEVDLGQLFDEVLAEETAPKQKERWEGYEIVVGADGRYLVREPVRAGGYQNLASFALSDKGVPQRVDHFFESEQTRAPVRKAIERWAQQQSEVTDSDIAAFNKARKDANTRQFDKGPHYSAGYHAFNSGVPRVLPSYFTSASGANAKEWYRGWDDANLAAPVRTAGEAAASAVKNTAAGLADAIDGLGKLFGSNGSRLSSGLTFDEETYKKAKPLFAQAIAHFKDAGQDLKESMRAVVRMVLDKFGPQVAENMRDYVVRFMEDVKAGNVVYDGGKENDNAEPENLSQRGRAETGNGEDDRGDGGARQPDRGPLGGRVSEGDAQAREPGQTDSGGEGSDAAGRGGPGVRGEESVGGRDRKPATAGDRPERTPSGLNEKADKTPSTEGVSISGKADFQISEEDAIGAGGQKTKARANIAAIRLLKKLEAEDRKATPAEQKILAKYVGWGGIKPIFDDAKAEWTKERDELKALLSAEEYAAARRSMLDAHYTSTDVVAGMWSAAQHLGFKGGRVLEPSVGVGNFFGMMPADLRAKSQLYGVELDKTSAMLARNLYPSATVANMGFQDVELPANSFDFIIGNPPFGKQALFDKNHPELRSFSIHNFFFAKAIDKLRPGGIMQMVVSHHLMDAIDSSARDYLAERADLIGAIRLPDSAFRANAGTDVVTDIIFLKKREPGSERGGFDWSDTAPISTAHPKTGEKFDFRINRYFTDHPEMVVGEHLPTGKMNGQPNQYNVEAKAGESLFEALGRALGNLPKDAMTPATKPLAEIAAADAVVPDGTKVYGYYISGSKVMQRLPDALDKRQAIEFDPIGETEEKIKSGTYESEKAIAQARGRAKNTLERVRLAIAVRIALRDLMRAELDDAPADRLAMLRDRLNTAYDVFFDKYGYINKPANRSAFKDDPDLPLLESLEPGYTPAVKEWTGEMKTVKHKDGTTSEARVMREAHPETAKKADIFTKRVLAPTHDVTSAASAKDALIASLNMHGEIDPDYMAEIYGKPWAEIHAELGDLVFHNPNGGWETADAYLSGNVKAKLKLAEDAAEQDPQYQANVEALRAVIPADVPALKISVRLGSPWVPPEVMQQFVADLWGDSKAVIRYVKQVAKWAVTSDGGDSVARTSTWGVTYGTLSGRSATFGADKILEHVANNRSIVIKENVGSSDEPIWRTNEPATEAIRAKAQEMADKFKEWIWQDEGRRESLAKIYNEKYNTDRRRAYDGSHLTLPGASPMIKLRKHQLNAIWRAIQDRTILLDHVVGAGKTFEKVAIAMELRRLGITRKPMFVVPNSLVRQWRDEFYKLYPNANVLAATEADFAKANRKRFMAKIATGDWDAVIVAHSSFKKIGMPQETEWAILKEQLDDMSDAIEDLKRERGDRNVVRDMERIKIKLEERMKALRESGGKKDDTVTFDELGTDGLLVDEAHLFKNLFYYSQMRNVTGLGNPSGSGRAFDLFVKIQYLMQRYAGKALTAFATGTPVSNSLVEMFTMQRYLAWNKLKESGLHLLDAWAGVYGDVQQVYEVHPSGTGYRLSTRFAKFVNLPSLMELYRSFADVVTMDDLKAQAKADGGRFPVPKIAGGRPRNIVAERSDLQRQFFGVPEFGRDEGGAIKFKYPAALKAKQSDKDGKWYPWLEGGSKVGQHGFDTELEAAEEAAALMMLPEVGWNPGSILHRFENLRELTRSSKGKINALSITNEARKAGLDYRLIDPAAPDFEGSKINLAIAEILRIHKDWKADRGAQLVFCDLSVPKSARAAAASKERIAYVRADDGSLIEVKATVVTIEGVDASFIAVKDKVRGKDQHALFHIYDGITGGYTGITGEHSKAVAVDKLKEAIDKRGLGWLEDLQDRYGEITEADIADYKDALGKDDAEAEDGDEGAISVAELLALAGGNTFSVYDDIKAKLLKAGIPESEVAFIHDYDTAAKKNDLFKKVRAGEIRVLLGSTEKMGAGMNVQERLVALHHLDAPWRPSDLEQREGRIVRQGNMLYERDPDGFEVEIMRYGTRQTYDTRMWQIIEHKAAGVEQLRKAGDDLLEIDDVGGEAANAADMKAAASGNPLILDEIKLRNEVKSLEAQQFAYIQAKASLQDKVRWYRGGPERARRHIEEIQPFIDAASNHPAESFAYVTEKGKTITDKKEVAAPLTEAFTLAAKDILGSQAEGGRYRGLTLKFRKAMGGILIYGDAGSGKAAPLASYSMDDKFSPSGLLQRLDNAMGKFAEEAQQETQRAEREVAQIPALEAEIAKPFAKDDALKEARAKHRAVVSKLQKSGGGIELTPEMKSELDAAIAERDKRHRQGMESRRASPEDLQFAASVLNELTEQDEAFRYPASKSADLKTVFAEVYPGAKFLGEHTREDERGETQADHRYVFLNHLGKTFYVYRTDAGRAWLDVSRLNNGDGGNQIYAAVANWAYNARLKFQGDPVGVSADATIRRTTNMLSSALRFGTTRHLDASLEQMKGDPENGVEPLKWGADEVENLRELIHTFITTLYNKFPSLNDYSYDFAKQGFFDKHGKPVTRERFDAGARTSFGRDARAGEATLRRGVFLKSLVSSASGERPAILENVLYRARALVESGLQGFLSKTTPAKAGVSVSGGRDAVAEIRGVADKFKAKFKGAAALHIRVVENAAEIPARFRPSPYAEGVFHDDAGLIYLVASNLRSANGGTDTGRAFQVLMHEAVGHYGLARMMGERFKSILPRVMTAAKAKGQVGEDIYQPGHTDYATVEAVKLRYPEASDEEIAQEVLARMAETEPGRTLFGYVRAVVRQWLRDAARSIGLELDVTTAELNDLVALASAYMRSGENLSGEAMPTGMAAASQRAGMESRRGATMAQPIAKESSRGLLDALLRKAGGELAAKITAPAYDKLTEFLGGKIPEGIKAGVVSDYGLDEGYIDRRTEMQTETQKGARKTKSFVEGLMDLDRAQSRIAYQWLNNRGEEADRLMAQLPPESRQVLEAIKQQIKALTAQAVSLGQLDVETAARNWGAYLHRSYAKYDLKTDDKTWRAERAKAIKILGDQYKGRGLKMEVDPDRIHSAKGWWDGEMKGKKVKVLKSEAGRYAFVAVGTAIPNALNSYNLEGVWEIRSSKAANQITLWRDFTAEERQMMGELDEAKYAVARTLFMMQRDIEIGRFHEWVADEYAKMPEEAEAEGLAMADASESMMRAFKPDEWVTVPVVKVPGTGVFKYGALAGLVVPGPVWNDVRQINAGRYEPFGSAFASILRAWKLSKTALTPTTHVNNVMGNFVMADMHDVGARDISQAVRLMLAASRGDKEAKALWDRFEDSGATQGMFTTHELKSEVLDPLMKALREEVGMADDEPAMLKVGAILSLAFHGKLAEAYAGAKATLKQSAAVRGTGAVVSKAQDYYQNEDVVFRFAAFLKGIEDGKTDLEAGKAARKAFLDYHINAPWINAMRGTAIPFVSFAYRAIPMLLDTAAKKPWKIAKYMVVAGGLNALAYLMLGADGDEDKERAFMPEEKAGRLWGIVPKLIRMPWNREGVDRNGKKFADPVFLDVRRWIPVGDAVDYGQDKTALPLIPQPLIPGGPLVMVAEFLVNKSAFTGKDITNRDTDTWVEQAAKVGEHFYKGFAPNVPGLPGTWATSKIVDAAKGKTDPLGRAYDLPSAALSGVGVKLAPYPVETLKYNAAIGMRGKMGDLDKEARAQRRDYSRGGLERVDLDESLGTIAEKKRKLAEDFKEKEARAARK